VGGEDVPARQLLLDFVAAQGRRPDSGARIYGSWQLLSRPIKPQVLFLSFDAFRSQPVIRHSAGQTSVPQIQLSPESPGAMLR
jgi:hypothetical protein